VCPRFPFVDTNISVHTPIILIHIVGVHTVRTGRLLPFIRYHVSARPLRALATTRSGP